MKKLNIITVISILLLSMNFVACSHNNISSSEDRTIAGGGPGEEALQSLIKTLVKSSNKTEATVIEVIRTRVPNAEKLGKSEIKINETDQLKIIESIKNARVNIANDLHISAESIEQAASNAAAGKAFENVWSSRASKINEIKMQAVSKTNPELKIDLNFQKIINNKSLTHETVEALTAYNKTMVASGIDERIRLKAIQSAANAAEAVGQPVIGRSCKNITKDSEALKNSIELTDMIPSQIKEGTSPQDALEVSISKKYNEGITKAKERCKRLCESPCNHLNCTLCN